MIRIDRVEREKKYNEIISSLENMNKNIQEKIEAQNKRISDLENWRWYILGMSIVIVFILNKISWTSVIFN
jgi:hypothetical protein